MQRLIAQRRSEGPTSLDEQTTQRIDQARSGGQELQPDLQAQMGQSMGADFSQVQVHTSQESDALNQELGAKAFTTGKDIFFRQGAYEPHTSAGKELIAHELTHVVQQSTGQVNHAGSGMAVNAPGDAFEQQADQVAHLAVAAPSGEKTTADGAASIQRALELTGESIQRQEMDEEEEVQMQVEEEEEELQMQTDEDEEEEELQMQEEEEELAQAKRG